MHPSTYVLLIRCGLVVCSSSVHQITVLDREAATSDEAMYSEREPKLLSLGQLTEHRAATTAKDFPSITKNRNVSVWFR